MLFDREFDLIFSIGEDCAYSSYLRRFNLQEYSYPFDWLTKADFTTRIELLLNNFSGFLQKENLSQIDKSTYKVVDEFNDYYKCAKTDFYFYHDFSNTLPFSKSYPLVKAKYQRRIERLYKQIAHSKDILMVWWVEISTKTYKISCITTKNFKANSQINAFFCF